ncbi:hypothetical protein SAMN02745135_02322 [Caloranaerobacter azorensis DSM 13643]|uniref:Uncharacterized protein n=1 Tax=Caloranaerobacter azorensis DSM 13643 TaxID=1121264 RepID=A0A1M5W6X3_9FIRM|nr:hypothetical protein [Caloranaerobacter azorensis]SHH83221.1 hypothetical protein SAMN02745135_02322 [Caloranaerobacter azorensis DSM 13643]
MLKRIASLLIANITGLVVFYLMYRVGIYLNVPLLQKYYLIPFTALIAYMVFEDYKEIKNYLRYEQTI